MKYRKDRYGKELSVLGYGCMRFSSQNGKIDLEKAEQEGIPLISTELSSYEISWRIHDALKEGV